MYIETCTGILINTDHITAFEFQDGLDEENKPIKRYDVIIVKTVSMDKFYKFVDFTKVSAHPNHCKHMKKWSIEQKKRFLTRLVEFSATEPVKVADFEYLFAFCSTGFHVEEETETT